MSKVCGICGGKTRTMSYKARDDNDTQLVCLPGLECVSCGAIEPDVDRIGRMPLAEVPSSVRIRCGAPREWAEEQTQATPTGAHDSPRRTP